MKAYTFLFFVLLLSVELTQAQYANLHDFNINDGYNPYGRLILYDSKFYGVTESGGTNGGGTVFSIKINGSEYRNILNFNKANLSSPNPSLCLENNILYGMTEYGGAKNSGTIFSVKTDGADYKVLFEFDCIHGASPLASVVISNGVLYGMTSRGGRIDLNYGYGYGTVFSINSDGTGYKTLYSFDGIDGNQPRNNLTISGNTLYGISTNCMFSINKDGSNYQCLSKNVTNAVGELILDCNVFYGTLPGGGPDNNGSIFSINKDGSDFKEIYTFNNISLETGGVNPRNLSRYGNVLYGATQNGDELLQGSVFSIHTDGREFRNLLNFNGSNGGASMGDFVIMDGVLFGLATSGGANNRGVLFSLNNLLSLNNSVPLNNAVTSQDYPATDDSDINTYPNPANGLFDLRYPVKNTANLVLTIQNVAGQTVYSDAVKQASGTYQKSIDLTRQNKGVYFIEINCGGQISTTKILLQ